MKNGIYKNFGRTEAHSVKIFETLNEYIQYLKDYQKRNNVKPVIFYIDYDNENVVFKHMMPTLPKINEAGNSLFHKHGILFDYDPSKCTYQVTMEAFDLLIDLGMDLTLLKSAKRTHVECCYSKPVHMRVQNTQVKEWVNKFMEAWRKNEL